MVWNWAHVHIIINHAPIIGVPLVSLLLLISLWSRELFMIRACLLMLILIGLAGGLVYYSGLQAELFAHSQTWKEEEGIIHAHGRFAKYGLIALAVSALSSLWSLSRLQNKDGSVNKPPVLITLLTGVAAAAVLAWTANLGGMINHPEIRESDWKERFPPSPHHE